MNIRAAVAAVIILLSCAPHAALARQQGASQNSEVRELREEVRRLREEQDGMRKELQEIKQLLEQARESAAPALPAFVSVDDDPFQGSADARVVIIDFSDYQ